jgi:hypothetical protein
MVLMVTTIYYPIDKASEVSKRYLESLQKYPPDASLSKTITIAVKATKNGIKVIGISDVVKGKYEEALIRLVRTEQEFFADIPGFSYEIDSFLDITEAMPIIGMEAPENR